MKATLKFDDFVGLCRTVVAKDDYERKMNDYYRLPALRRAFTRRPADPARGMETFHLHNMLNHAFRCVFPEFADVTISDGRMFDAHTARCEFSFDRKTGMPLLRLAVHDNASNTVSSEDFEYRKGYGFIHSYQHDDNSEKDASNRRYAFQHAMDCRYGSDWAQRIYSKFDRFRFSDEVRLAWGSPRLEYDSLPRSERRRMAEGLKAATEAVNGRLNIINKAEVEKKLAEVQGIYKVRSFVEYLGNARDVRDVAQRTMRDPEKNTPDYRALAEVRMDANRKVTDAALFSFAIDEMMAQNTSNYPSWKRVARSPVPSLEVLLDYACKVTSLSMEKEGSLHLKMKNVYDTFVSAAVRNGYEVDSIRNAVRTDMVANDYAVDEPDYGKIKAAVERDYRMEVDRQVAEGAVHVSLPGDPYPELMERADRMSLCKDFLEEVGFGTMSRRELANKADLIGTLMFLHGRHGVSPEVMGYFGVETSKVQAGFDKALGIRAASESVKGEPMKKVVFKDISKIDGVSVFQNEVIDAINYLNHKVGSPDNRLSESCRQLGAFLRELGVETSNGKSMNLNINEAIGRTYGTVGRGGAEDFRQKFSDVFDKARAFARERSPRRKEEEQKMRKNSGPKLG